MSSKNKFIISSINDKYGSFKRLKRIYKDLKREGDTPSLYFENIIKNKKIELLKMICIQKKLLNELIMLIFSQIKTDIDNITIESCIDDLIQLTIGQNMKKIQMVASVTVFPNKIIYHVEIFYYDAFFKKFHLYITSVR